MPDGFHVFLNDLYCGIILWVRDYEAFLALTGFTTVRIRTTDGVALLVGTLRQHS